MLTVNNRQLNNVFERIVKDRNGAFVCVRFTVLNINGKLQGQILSVTPLTVTKTNNEVSVGQNTACLPCAKDDTLPVTKSVISFNNLVSPFTRLDFLMSQPTRAPAL